MNSVKIAILTNDPLWTYNLRREVVQKLIEEGNEVTLVLPYGEKIEYFKKLGCGFVDFPDAIMRSFPAETVGEVLLQAM